MKGDVGGRSRHGGSCRTIALGEYKRKPPPRMAGVGRESHTAERSCRALKPKLWTSRSSASGFPWVHVPRRRMGCLSPSTRPNLIARPLFLNRDYEPPRKMPRWPTIFAPTSKLTRSDKPSMSRGVFTGSTRKGCDEPFKRATAIVRAISLAVSR